MSKCALCSNLTSLYLIIVTHGPELPLQRSNDAAAQLSLSGRSFIVQHLDRFMGKKLHDVAN
jgi:hypothetical protein